MRWSQTLNIPEHPQTFLQSTWMVAKLFSTLLPTGWILTLRNKRSTVSWFSKPYSLTALCWLYKGSNVSNTFQWGRQHMSKMRHKPTTPLLVVTLINVGTYSDPIKPILMSTLHDWEPGLEVKKDLSPWRSKPAHGLTLCCRYGGGEMCCKGWFPPGNCQGIPQALWAICIFCTDPKKKIFIALGDDLGNSISNLYRRNSSEF